MPSTFTERIETDPTYTFAEFAWFCSRGLMVSILLRDGPSRIPTPDDVTEAIGQAGVEQCKACVESARAGLAAAEARTHDDWVRETAEANQRRLTEYEESLRDSAVVAARYEAMKAKVEAWSPPTPEHAGLKKYMLEQIQDSTRYSGPGERPVPQTADERRAMVLGMRESSLRSEVERLARATANAAYREAWFTALDASIPLPTRSVP